MLIKKRVNEKESERAWMYEKEDHFSPNIMEENSDNPLEVRSMMKQIDEVNHQMTEIVTGAFTVINQMKEMMEFHEAAKKSIFYQQKKHQKRC